MRTSRLQLLQQASNFRRILLDPDVPPEVKSLYRKALDHAEVLIGLDAAVKRKAARAAAAQETTKDQ
jgi:hypothetical protein